MSTYQEKLNILLKFKSLLYETSNKFIIWIGAKFLILYTFMIATTITLAYAGFGQLQTSTDLFTRYPIFEPIVSIILIIMSLTPIILFIIYIVYVGMVLLEDHYRKMIDIIK